MFFLIKSSNGISIFPLGQKKKNTASELFFIQFHFQSSAGALICFEWHLAARI